MSAASRAALAALLLGASAVAAGAATRDRIKAEGIIRCAAVERPGLMMRGEDGAPVGLLADLCRAAGVAAGGPGIRVVVDVLEGDPSFAAVSKGRDDLVFLTGTELVDHGLAAALLPGPAVFYETSAVMVAPNAPAQRPADLAGAPICFMQGTPAQRHLEAFAAARQLSFIRMGYQEDIEMDDAFDAQRCRAIAGEATTLAAIRLDGGVNRRGGRILAETLATYPIFAATALGDPAWSAAVAWTVATLQDADRPTGAWAAGGAASLPVVAPSLGLPGGWQAQVIAQTGSYADIRRRTLGDGSPLRLEAGPNALASVGGLLTPPFAE